MEGRMTTELFNCGSAKSISGRAATGLVRCLQAAMAVTLIVASATFAKSEAPELIVLGVAQDGGYPQAGCQRECCQAAWEQAERRRFVSCLAIVDPDSAERWLLDCTPDFPEQLRLLDQLTRPADSAAQRPKPLLNGILLTHAHIGHYTGLMHLGREVLSADGIPVFCMPRMRYFLESNGPWSQLVKLKQIELRRLAAAQATRLNGRLEVSPFLVPHRDEYSETVGFHIRGPERSAIYLPDIDKWERWEVDIEQLLKSVELAFVDGTFYANGELPGRDMSEIPHPFITESMQRFLKLPASERGKLHFIHLNHSNPALQASSPAVEAIHQAGMHVAQQASRFSL